MKSANLILYNANVITLDPQKPKAELVAVKDGKIIHVGANNDLSEFKRTKLIDCEGKTLIPGFNDAHTHVLAFASSLLNIDLSPNSISSIIEIQGKIREQAKHTPYGAWIKGTGYNEFYLAEKRHPTRWDLDQAAPHHPVKLVHRSRHACVLNSLALNLAHISIETHDPPGGLIERDLNTGEPTGLLFGMNKYISRYVEPPLSEEELEEGIKKANQEFLSGGITSLQDATAHNNLKRWQIFQNLKKKGVFAPRIYMMIGLDALAEVQDEGMLFGFGDHELRLGAVKIAIDETRGTLNPPQAELNEKVLLTHKAGFQVAIHAIEERTVEAAITALEYALHQAPKADHRHRIEHCSECPPELLSRLKDIHAIVVTQPSFIYYSGERYSAEVPSSQLPWLYRAGSFLENELKLAASSDTPVVPPNPLIGIYAAVIRKAENGEVLSPEEIISPDQALRIYTTGGTYASFEEGLKGNIAIGRLADLVLLSANPTQVPPEEIKEIQVEKTIVGGKVVWERS